jgi:IclR family transcriptional regulator, KDG regulon repressor
MNSDNLLRRGLFVIENLSALGSLSTDQLAAKTGIPKSSVYRILRILEDFDYVSRSKLEREDRWTLDLKFLTLSANILSRVDLKTEIRDILVKLADDTREIVQLAVWRNGKVVIVDNVKKHSSLVSVAHEGTSLSINCCTAGLVFGAQMDGEELESVLKASSFPALTQYTITDPVDLRKQFARVRENGYALDDQYYAIGHRCIGAPVFDYTGKVVAEINISGHIQTITDDRIEELATKVMGRAVEASQRMGYVARPRHDGLSVK